MIGTEPWDNNLTLQRVNPHVEPREAIRLPLAAFNAWHSRKQNESLRLLWQEEQTTDHKIREDSDIYTTLSLEFLIFAGQQLDLSPYSALIPD